MQAQRICRSTSQKCKRSSLPSSKQRPFAQLAARATLDSGEGQSMEPAAVLAVENRLRPQRKADRLPPSRAEYWFISGWACRTT